MKTKPNPNLHNVLGIYGIGVLIGFLSLYLNQQYPVIMTVGSVLSPTGGQFTLIGFRIKHWLFGFVLIIIGYLSFNEESTIIKQSGIGMMGIGSALIVDEYTDVYNFLITRKYP